MAIFNYTKEEIMTLKPEEGELILLNFLRENLDDSYEVYFQLNLGNLNRNYPDIIITRKGYGVLVIEVKNFNQNSFICNQKCKNKETSTEQAKRYRDELRNVKGLEHDDLVQCAVYLHGYTEKEAINQLSQYDKEYKKNFNYYCVIGMDSLGVKFNEILKKTGLDRSDKSFFFTEELYKNFKSLFENSTRKGEKFRWIDGKDTSIEKIDLTNFIKIINNNKRIEEELENLPESPAKDYYILFKSKLMSKNIEIIFVQHNKFQEKYILKRKNEIAVIDFYYDKTGILTASTHQKINSENLLKDIKEICLKT